MEAYSQPVQTDRGPSVAPLTVGRLRAILKNIPAECDDRRIIDSNRNLVEVLTDEDWLNHITSSDGLFITLHIR